jgi:hypothetical protein
MKMEFADYSLVDLSKIESESFKQLVDTSKTRIYNGGFKVLKFTRTEGNRKNYLNRGKLSNTDHFKQIIKASFIIDGLALLGIKTTPHLIEEQNVNPCEQIIDYDGLSRFIGELATVLSLGGAYASRLLENGSHKKFLLQSLHFAESFFGEHFFDYYYLRVSGIMWNDWLGDYWSESYFIFDNDGTECVLLMISDSA